MKNHFIFSYNGNKREEVETIYNNIDFTNIKTVIEPFCGTSALSYYIATKRPKEFTYYINDNNKYLIDLYNILKCSIKTEKLNKEYNELAKTLNKEKYLKIINDETTIAYLIKSKIFNIRCGLFPVSYKYKEIDFNDFPIVNFLRSETVIITCDNALDILKKNKDNNDTFIFLDPPYLSSCNTHYLIPDTNVYEYLIDNNIDDFKCQLILVLENNWIIKLLFKGKHFITYDKLYQSSKKKTTHLLIANYKLKEVKLVEQTEKLPKIKRVKPIKNEVQ